MSDAPDPWRPVLDYLPRLALWAILVVLGWGVSQLTGQLAPVPPLPQPIPLAVPQEVKP